MSDDRKRLPGGEHGAEREHEGEQEHGGGLFDGPDRAFRMAQAHRHRQRVMRKKAEGADKADGEHEVSQPGDAAEKEADHVADHVADGLHGDGEKGGERGDKPQAGKEQAPVIGAKLKDGAVSLAKKPGANANQLPLPGMGAPQQAGQQQPPAQHQGAQGAQQQQGAPQAQGTLAPHADVRHVFEENGKYAIRPEWRGQIREKFYARDYNSAVKKWKTKMLTTPKSKGGLRHETDPAQYEYQGKFYKNEGGTAASIGHENPNVCTHWNEIGHNVAQSARINYFNGDGSPETKLTLQPVSMNKSEGASKGERYTFFVGPNFMGPGQ